MITLALFLLPSYINKARAGNQSRVTLHRGVKLTFTYHQLKVFCTTIEKGSLVKAAKDLVTSQPAVTHHIKSLEQHFGVPLLLRSSRGINLTEVGTRVYEAAQNILREINAVEEYVTAYKNPTTYNIGASLTVGIYILPRIIAKFQQSYPDIVIQLKVDKARNLIGGVSNNELDLLFRVFPVSKVDLMVSPVFDDKVILVGSNELLSDHDEPVDNIIKRIATQKIIYLPQDSPQQRERVYEKLKAVRLELIITKEINHPEAAKEAVESGLGVALMYNCSVIKELKAGFIRKVPIDLGLSTTFGFMWKRENKLPQPLIRFMEITREQIC